MVNGAIDIQLVCSALTGEFAQTPQRHLDVARTQFHLIIQVLVFALIPDLDCLALAFAGVSDSNTLRVETTGTKRAGTTGADPFVAAFVALFLLFEAFLKFFDQLVETTKGLDLGLLFLSQHALELLAQPIIGNHRLNQLIEVFQPLEIGTKGTVELVEMAFILDHDRTRQIVKLVHIGEHHMVLQRIDQIEQLANRHRYLGCTHFIEQAQ